MAVNFTPEELEIIGRQAKPTTMLPTYYSSQSKSSIPVGRDFEGFLILQNIDQKQQVLTWLREVNSISEENTDRDELLIRYIGLRSADADTRIAEIDEQMKGFTDFKSNLFSNVEDPAKFAGLVELNVMLQSLQKPVSEMASQRDLAFHEKNMAALTLTRLQRSKNDEDTQRELRSWQTVITAYPGQVGG
jgi:hypothetical protein